MDTKITDSLTGVNHEGAKANTPLRFLTASSIIGDKVHDKNDEAIGEIKDIMLNIATGTIDYVVVEFGGFLGIGIKYFAIPFNKLRVDAERKMFIFERTKEILNDAPGFDLNHWPDTNLHPEETYWSFV